MKLKDIQKKAITDYKAIICENGPMTRYEIQQAVQVDEAFEGATDETIEAAVEEILRKSTRGRKPGPAVPPKEELEDLYIGLEKTCRDIAEIYEVTVGAVCYWLKKCGIAARPKSLPVKLDTQTREKMQALYVVKGLSMADTAAELGVSATTVRRWMKEYKIPSRTAGGARVKKAQKGDCNGTQQVE